MANASLLEGELMNLKENVDQVFLLTNAIFVCLMQCGFACLEAGSIRAKNATNIIMKNVMDIFISCFAYWLVGYAFAYGEGDHPFIGLTYWAGIGIPAGKFAHWFFQFVFAATAATIVSGAVAERCNFVAYIVYSAVISGFIYPVVSHWVWGTGGWLAALGYSDFAGSGAVHMLGGTSSLIGAAFLGPRAGRFEGREMPGHSTPLIGLGGMILIAGFLAFNGGSLGTMTTPHAGATIAVVIANTVMGGTGAILTSLICGKLGMVGPKVWNFSLTLNAGLTGMVSVCASADQLLLWSAFVSGVIAAFVYIGAHKLVPLCKIDDPLDAIAVHLGGGLWGLMAGPLFSYGGIVYGPNTQSLMVLVYNLTGALAIFLWTAITCSIMFATLRSLNFLRVTEEEERRGLDITKHNEPAYPAAGWKDPEAFKDQEINGNKPSKKQKSRQDYTNAAFEHHF